MFAGPLCYSNLLLYLENNLTPINPHTPLVGVSFRFTSDKLIQIKMQKCMPANCHAHIRHGTNKLRLVCWLQLM